VELQVDDYKLAKWEA